MSIGKSIRLFLTDGKPGGLLTAEIGNWTGHVVVAPRSDLATLLKRPEVGRTGVYILLGDDPDSLGDQQAYVGEGDDVGKRLYQHARSADQGGKDFWNRALVLTSKDVNLTKAHARYLESRFIELARQANRASLTNGTAPPVPQLPEADVSDMEYFIEQARVILPVLGVNILRSVAVNAPPGRADAASESPEISPVFELTMKREGILATAQQVDGEFTVLEGSMARKRWVGNLEWASYTALREKLEKDGTLAFGQPDGNMRFTRAQVFSSPSAAAAVVLGRSANGRIEWIMRATGETYGAWETRGAGEVMRDEDTDL